MGDRELWDRVDVDLYEALGVSSDADDDQIQRAWHRAARLTHPDAGGDTGTFHDVHIAYLVLSDPINRLDYDRSRTPGQVPDMVPAGPTDLRTDGDPVNVRLLWLLAAVVITAITLSYLWPWFAIVVGLGVGCFVLTRYFRHWNRRGSIF